ncbi:MAG TPA: YjbH domain-containing protein, partial [Burkholderiaceae bacterium]|nr:YjbH domain-containing protein [Burkholderiaceae bacterium]
HGDDISDRPGWEGYGDYKDKSAGFKLRLLPENAFGTTWLPEVSAGIDDFHGTQLFRAEFVAATKRLDMGWATVDATVGYGRKRIAGLFGGARFRLKQLPSWALVAEYDRTDYRNDRRFAYTGQPSRRTGAWGAALEYNWQGLHFQVGRMHGQTVFNVALSVPLDGKRELIPNIDETGPFAGGLWANARPRPTAQQWHDSNEYRLGLLQALHAEGLRNVRFAWRDGTLAMSFSGDRYRWASRGVGRAATLAMAYAPIETKRLEITWEVNGVAGMVWEFYDVSVLQRYLAGTASRAQLAHSLNLRYASPTGRSEAARANDVDATIQALARERGRGFYYGQSLLGFSASTYGQTSFTLNPYFHAHLNDPNGAFRYDTGLSLDANINLARGWWLTGGIRGSVHETVTKSSQASNSRLPHVRSDVTEYRRAARVKLDRLLLNRYWQAAPRTYFRASAGLYEEMFGGVGVQGLYLSPGGRFAWDFSLDAVRQRNYKGTGFKNYKTVTAIGSMHYKVHGFEGLTATVRVGKFLARDVGVRFELARQFRSGVELGVWYTRTDGKDITSPGRPGSPYHDKGVFLRIPISTLTSRDTAAHADARISPWARDVGQMVESPDDLYLLMRRSWLNNALESDGLRSFADVPGEDQP